jgi:hypothetical protein
MNGNGSGMLIIEEEIPLGLGVQDLGRDRPAVCPVCGRQAVRRGQDLVCENVSCPCG